ncbi:porin family protein [Hymenobacter sp. BT770]|uniref:porin family protein n=1 Tax=Hymenobacter sp. BT770 TaxID=2886942 RepID=UPI001D112CFB|nr:porin family protein [Hymenobacter sp. BT770]MCC3154839.1 PorT family protein [Hymenobacter sp. BT770]MDO3416786.1 porin family protein [Hymenobacter sp. BT770]
MKKAILSLGLLAGMVGAAQAQTGMKIGLKAGANMSSFTGTDKQDVTSRFGISAGATFNFALSDMIAVQPEVLFSQKGMKLRYTGEDSSDATVFNSTGNVSGTLGQTLSYIDVPVLLRVNTGGSSGEGLFFELGPQASFLIGQKSAIDTGDKATVVLAGPNRTNPQGDSMPAFAVGTSTDDFNRIAFGYVAGFGYQLPNGLSMGIRYAGDISQVYKDGNGTADALKPYQAFGAKFTNPKVHNSVFQLQVGYTLGL